jgi:hypothetical protein
MPQSMAVKVMRSKKARRPRRSVPYTKVAKMWKHKKPLAVIARAIGFVDKNNSNDPYHSFRNVLYRMFNYGYVNEDGKHCILRRRVSQSTVRACRKAGKRAWAPKRRSTA